MTDLCKALPIVLLSTIFASQCYAIQPCGEITEKTLVAWVSPANLEQQGGSVVSMMRGEQFDAIVPGEIQQGRWMPGSDYFRRTAGTRMAGSQRRRSQVNKSRSRSFIRETTSRFIATDSVTPSTRPTDDKHFCGGTTY